MVKYLPDGEFFEILPSHGHSSPCARLKLVVRHHPYASSP
jgi:hypothetical protein